MWWVGGWVGGWVVEGGEGVVGGGRGCGGGGRGREGGEIVEQECHAREGMDQQRRWGAGNARGTSKMDKFAGLRASAAPCQLAIHLPRAACAHVQQALTVKRYERLWVQRLAPRLHHIMAPLPTRLCTSCSPCAGIVISGRSRNEALLPRLQGQAAAAASCQPRRRPRGLLLPSLPCRAVAADIQLAMEPPEAAESW